MDSDDDDLYDPAEAVPVISQSYAGGTRGEVNMEDVEDGEEEGEEVEEDDSDDDDINFITDQKEESKSEPTSQAKRQPSTAAPSSDPRRASVTPIPTARSEATQDAKSSSQPLDEKPRTEYPGYHTSTIDPDGNPIHPTTGKPILSTDFDADFPSESSKPWRKPGSDITDYFNYGFDEFTWASYCLKQQQMPKEITEIKNQAEYMKAFVEGIPGGEVPGMSAAPTGPAGAAATANGSISQMPGMPSEQEMQQMFAGMMAQGMDPSTMDPSQFMQMMMGGGTGVQGFGGQAQGFGTGQGTGQQPQQQQQQQQQQKQQMGFATGGTGFDQGGNFGGTRGRGRGGGRRNW